MVGRDAIGAAVVAVTVGFAFSQQPQSAQATEDESPNNTKAVIIKRDIVISLGSCEPTNKYREVKNQKGPVSKLPTAKPNTARPRIANERVEAEESARELPQAENLQEKRARNHSRREISFARLATELGRREAGDRTQHRASMRRLGQKRLPSLEPRLAPNTTGRDRVGIAPAHQARAYTAHFAQPLPETCIGS